MRVNLGCGRSPLDGWVNVDAVPLDGVDLVIDLDRPDRWKFDLPEAVIEWQANHLIEHINHPLRLYEAMWEASAPGAVAVFRCPHGASDEAWGDPTHVRPMFEQSFHYASQPSYFKADYDYRGDWNVDYVTLKVPAGLLDDRGHEGAYAVVRNQRNIVSEMEAHLIAVKPARAPVANLRTPPRIVLEGV